jgi:hypothetical protein
VPSSAKAAFGPEVIEAGTTDSGSYIAPLTGSGSGAAPTAGERTGSVERNGPHTLPATRGAASA